jgi:regulator of RNase E activity RraB
VKDRKGHTVKVSRKGYIDLSRDPNHISEIALDNFKFDYEISVEEGDLKTLREDAIFVFDAILQSYTPETPEIDASEIVAA